MSSRGFTLVEVMVAIALSGVIALIVFGTLYAGVDTSERVDQHKAHASAQVILRQVLMDALRRPVDGGGAAMNDTLFLLDDRVSANGEPGDGLVFVTRGIGSHVASGAWRVMLAPTASGLKLRAEPARPGAAPLELTVERIRGLDVYVLDRSADAQWLDHWPYAGRVPAAISLHFVGEAGAPVLAPLVVHTALEPVR